MLVQVVLPIPPPKEVLIKAGDGVTVEASTLTSGGNVAGSSPRHYATNTGLIVVGLELQPIGQASAGKSLGGTFAGPNGGSFQTRLYAYSATVRYSSNGTN